MPESGLHLDWNLSSANFKPLFGSSTTSFLLGYSLVLPNSDFSPESYTAVLNFGQ